MATITVPKTFSGGERNLVAVPQEEYKAFLAWQKKIKSQKTFHPTKDEKKALLRARRNLSHRSYTELSQLKHELEGPRR